jgi:hypothetical protein
MENFSATAVELRRFPFSMLSSAVLAPAHNSLDDGIPHHLRDAFFTGDGS